MYKLLLKSIYNTIIFTKNYVFLSVMCQTSANVLFANGTSMPQVLFKLKVYLCLSFVNNIKICFLNMIGMLVII